MKVGNCCLIKADRTSKVSFQAAWARILGHIARFRLVFFCYLGSDHGKDHTNCHCCFSNHKRVPYFATGASHVLISSVGLFCFNKIFLFLIAAVYLIRFDKYVLEILEKSLLK